MARPATERIGQAIEAARAHANISQSELARRLRARGWAVDQSRISRWIRGVDVPSDILQYPAIEEECGVARGTILKRAGFVDAESPCNVVTAIDMDPDLDERGRRLMRTQYEVLRALAATRVGTAAS